VVGDDRPGLVNALAEQVSAVGGNWERSELAELAGAFAGIVLVTIDDDRRADLVSALEGLDGMLRVTVHGGRAGLTADTAERSLEVTVLGNDRPGIVRDVTAAIAGRALSIDTFRSRTLDAPMAGGTLFEATVAFSLPAGADAGTVTRALEELAGEIQVDLTVA